ncbi:hypothetical protein T4E_11989 [Trichinella pseudospiralis]|uniref:Uncharacterized protein n=1 Tax=Trichinella pseudospiralis TaxID=6337 RepID=A0A0V0Y6J9_TRIPS|nr:hypothetical protein T4E_11989 [Trichinella pseudospiralis]
MISEHQEPLTIERQMSRYVKIGAEVAASERQTPPGNLVSISTQRLILVTDVDQALGPYQSSQGCLHETLKELPQTRQSVNVSSIQDRRCASDGLRCSAVSSQRKINTTHPSLLSALLGTPMDYTITQRRRDVSSCSVTIPPCPLVLCDRSRCSYRLSIPTRLKIIPRFCSMPDSTKWLASASCFLLLRQHLLHCNQNLAPYTGKFYPNNCHGNGLGEQDVRLPYSQSATRIRVQM